MDLYLTGSRFFGNPKKDSDHDYLGQYTEENLKLLLEKGYSVGSVFLSKGKEDIFLVNNINKFLKARNILKELPLSNFPKEAHGYLWAQALDIIGSK